MPTPTEILERAEKFVYDNLSDLCMECLVLETERISPADSKLHKLADMVKPLTSGIAISLAISLIQRAAITKLAATLKL